MFHLIQTQFEKGTNRITGIAMLGCLTLLNACTLQWSNASDSGLVFNRKVLRPPYYIPMGTAAGEVGYFPVHVDPLIEVESLRDSNMYNYLSNALPLLSQYLQQKLSGRVLERYTHQWPKWPQHGLVETYSPENTNSLLLIDLPRIHYGRPEHVLGPDWRRSGSAPDSTESMLTLVKGSGKWYRYFLENYHDDIPEYILDISIGIIDVSSQPNMLLEGLDAKNSIRDKLKQVAANAGNTLYLGSKLQTPSPVSGVSPFTTVALKGLIYDRKGNVIAGAVEGIAALTTIEQNTFLVSGASQQNYNIEELGDLNTYPWKTAMDSLLQHLLPTNSLNQQVGFATVEQTKE
ncbi:MAG: hypothetical protein OEZ43_14045 [Gammaproteobacteria bacterium]|nr:hypothetical protein [Gammaproteobacteria bacterium]